MTDKSEELIEILTSFICNKIIVGSDSVELGPTDELLDDSLVDSLGIMKLVAFIEERFQFVVPPEDVTIENFLTINAIKDYLAPKLVDHVD